MEHNKPKGPNWFLVILAALMLGGVYLNQARKINILNEKIDILSSQLSSLEEQTVRYDSFHRLSKQVDNLEKSAADAPAQPLVNTWNALVTHVDPAAKTVTFHVQVNANAIGEEAQVSVSHYGHTDFFPLTLSGLGNYQGTVSIPIRKENSPVTLLFSGQVSGEKRTEPLQTYEEAWQIMPVSLATSATANLSYSPYGGKPYGGRFQCDCSGIGFLNAREAWVEAYVNGEIVQTVSPEGEDSILDLTVSPGDEISLVYVAEDDWGVTYRYSGKGWRIKSDGFERNYPDTLVPQLVWPEVKP